VCRAALHCCAAPPRPPPPSGLTHSPHFTLFFFSAQGEPTPYSWPNINSHFGIFDIAGFYKDRAHWYRANFIRDTPYVHAFPPWNLQANGVSPGPIWAFSNADEVELLVNGASQGRVAMPLYGHAAWPAVPYVPGSYTVNAYATNGSVPVASKTVTTAGAPASLRISVKDGMPGPLGLIAGCKDVALVQVEVVDAAGTVVPSAGNNVTFTVSGSAGATLGGTGSGDPSDHTNDKSPARPAFHGMVLAVVLGGAAPGTVTVAAAADGLAPVSLDIPQVAPPPGWSAPWCHTNPTL
jgi:beta-galactosidase